MGGLLQWAATFLAGLLRGLVGDWRSREALRGEGRAEIERRQHEVDEEMRRRAAEVAAGSDHDPRTDNERLRERGALRDE